MRGDPSPRAQASVPAQHCEAYRASMHVICSIKTVFSFSGLPEQFTRTQTNTPYSHKLLTINNYVNFPSNFAFARSIYLFHPPIFEKIPMRIRSIRLI